MIQIVSAKDDVNHQLSKDELLSFFFLQYLLSFTVKNRILGKINFDLTLHVGLMSLCYYLFTTTIWEDVSKKRGSYILENKLDQDSPSRGSAPQKEYSTLPFYCQPVFGFHLKKRCEPGMLKWLLLWKRSLISSVSSVYCPALLSWWCAKGLPDLQSPLLATITSFMLLWLQLWSS